MTLYQLLQSYGIEVKLTGEGTTQEDFLIQCIFCGDSSFNLSIRHDGTAWKCWKDSSHRGRNISYLLWKLNIPRGIKFEGSDKVANNKPKIIKDIELPLSVKLESFQDRKVDTFLWKRGMPRELLQGQGYSIYVAPLSVQGDYSGRVLLPSVDSNGKLEYVYTRSYIYGIEPKHKILSSNKMSLYNSIGLNPESYIVAFESPLDAVKFEVISHSLDRRDVCCTAYCTSMPNTHQIKQLRMFKKLFYFPDNDHLLSKVISTMLSYCPQAKRIKTPIPVKDIGDLSFEDSVVVIDKILREELV